jgi:ribonuclease HI
LTREYCGDRATNNYAEYKGLLAGLKQAKNCIEQYSSKQSSSTKSSPTNPLFLLQIYGDSNLVIQHLKGAWQCKNPNIKPLFHQCQQVIGEMKKMDSNSKVLLEHIYREQNKVADGKLHYQKKLLVLNDAVGRYHLT